MEFIPDILNILSTVGIVNGLRLPAACHHSLICGLLSLRTTRLALRFSEHRLLSFHPFPALIRPALMTFIRSLVDHLFLISIIPAPVRRGIHLLPRKIEDTRAAMRAISSSPAGIIDCLVTVATIPFYDLIIRKFRPPIRWLALWLAWDIGRRDVCR